MRSRRALAAVRVPKARMVCVAFVANGTSVVDGSRGGGMRDVVGFETAAPTLIGDFLRGASAL